MSSAATFDPDRVQLTAADAAFEALRAGTRSEELEAAGATTDGRLHPALEPAVTAMRAPVCDVRMQRGERQGHGWVDAQVAALLVPADEGRMRMTVLPTAFLPDALARLNDLAPRPRVKRAVELHLTPAQLAVVLAGSPDAGSDDDDAADALRSIAATKREHWRVDVTWEPAEDADATRGVEVIDTDDGLWLIQARDDDVAVWPTTPTVVFRLLCGLLPHNDELAGS
jgi:hypothetical protein